ncbi:MAG TPA: aminoglycoside adenylyltransferase domain-containing protein [Caulobacteraceae bacterium]
MTQSHPSAPAGATALAVNPSPTPYAELNAVLTDLVTGARTALGDNFVGAYLQGSFALGDFDESSDLDFLIVTREDIGPGALPALQTFHTRLHAQPSNWAQRLEGSYVPAAILKHKDGAPRDPPGEPRADDWADPGTSGTPPSVYPFYFLGNGEQALVRSEHDNSQIVRWITREAGIVLAGPPPSELIDPVPAEALKAETRETLAKVLRIALDEGQPLGQLWLQAFFVTLSCRMLHVLDGGRVTSKKAASAWALKALDRRWGPLIEAAMAARRQPLEARLAPPPQADVAETLAFLRHVRARAIIERQLALKKHAGGHHPSGRPPAGDGPGGRPSRGPAPIRPGGRGRRG